MWCYMSLSQINAVNTFFIFTLFVNKFSLIVLGIFVQFWAIHLPHDPLISYM